MRLCASEIRRLARSYKLAMDLPTIPYIIGDTIIFFHSMSHTVTPRTHVILAIYVTMSLMRNQELKHLVYLTT